MQPAVLVIMKEKRILIGISMNHRIRSFREIVKHITVGLTVIMSAMQSILGLREQMLLAVMKLDVPAFSVLAGAGR